MSTGANLSLVSIGVEGITGNDPHDVAARKLADRFHEMYIRPAARSGRPEPEEEDGRCHCATPLPALETEVDEPTARRFHCSTCGGELKTDREGRPCRRLMGDLDTDEQVQGRRVLEAAARNKAEMLELVNSLPRKTQARLAKLKRAEFEKVARRMIDLRERLKATDGVDLRGPNQRRRDQRIANNFADVVDAISQEAGR